MLIPIGQFSKMTRLSVKALRLYAENGLLSPSHVDSTTGYRYYEPTLARRAELIRLLRLAGLSLEGIRAFLDADLANATMQLAAHRQQLMDRVAMYDRSVSYVMSFVQSKEAGMHYEATLTDVPTQAIAAVRIRTSMQSMSQDIPMGFGKLMQGLMRNGGRAKGVPMLIYHDVIDQDTDGDLEVAVPVQDDFIGDADVYRRELTGGPAVTTLHLGPYEQIAPAYHFLAQWIAANGYEVTGPPREIYLNDPRQVVPAELLTRVEFPIGNAGAVGARLANKEHRADQSRLGDEE